MYRKIFIKYFINKLYKYLLGIYLLFATVYLPQGICTLHSKGFRNFLLVVFRNNKQTALRLQH